jgi:hypothetical protein
MKKHSIKYSTFPRTEPPPEFAAKIVAVFQKHEMQIGTVNLMKGLESDDVLAIVASDLQQLGFDVETGKRNDQKIQRPVFYGENGIPRVRYQIDAFSSAWKCGLEIEAGRAWMGNAVYRDLIQASVMVEVDYLCLAVPISYKYKSKHWDVMSNDYDNLCNLAEALYGHTRLRLPYRLIVIGY